MIETPRFWLLDELIPAVIQDYETHEVLMVGYMNQEAWGLTISTGKTHFYSRKKKRIWLKGEQSGHFQLVRQVLLNCDNTCLLLKVEQIGGACDLGFKSCFDKTLEDGEFVSTGERVFDPGDVYGEQFTEKILLGIPSGSLEAMTFRLLSLAGYEVARASDRSYHPTAANDPNLTLFMARAQELPLLVGQGFLDAALTGMDWVEETAAPVRDVGDLGYNKLGLGSVTLALAIPSETTIGSLRELEGKRIATAYQDLTRRFFRSKGISVETILSIGATEGKVPLIADAIVELVETGMTLQANGLKPVLKLYETTVHLIASNASWGYTWKRRKLEEIGERLASAARNLPQNPKTRTDLATEYPPIAGA